jgi:hypothetical protein
MFLEAVKLYPFPLRPVDLAGITAFIMLHDHGFPGKAELLPRGEALGHLAGNCIEGCDSAVHQFQCEVIFLSTLHCSFIKPDCHIGEKLTVGIGLKQFGGGLVQRFDEGDDVKAFGA